MTDNDGVVIVSAVRTPFGRYGGSLRDIDYYDLGAIPMKEVLGRVEVNPDAVGEVFPDNHSSRQGFLMRHPLFPSIWHVCQRCMRLS